MKVATIDQLRARRAWLVGAESLDSNKAEARTQFTRAVELDEFMADAWLGLHAVGERKDEAVAALVRTESRFGEERTRNKRRLASRFQLGGYIDYGLEDHADLWCAVAAGHLDRDEHVHAASALKRVANVPPANFLRGRLAFARGEHDLALHHFRTVIGGEDKFIDAEARLFSAVLLAGVGALGLAHQHATYLLSQTFLPSIHGETHFMLARAMQAAGRDREALAHLHHAYAANPTLPGLRAAIDEFETVRIPLAAGVASADAPSATPAPPEETEETVDDILAELDRQIGQEGIKQQVRKLLAQSRASIRRAEAGLPQTRLTRHLVFVGPPGTGKTTIARLVARLYRALGVLESGHVVEVDRSGLIGEYHGHTVAQTKSVLDEARGGVLFIDEAYALQTEGFHHGDPFGKEAIDTILKRMEDDRGNFIVIAAGYPEPMERFLDSNPGLRSRFSNTIRFDAYSTDDLLSIAKLMATDAGDVLTEDAKTALWLHLTTMENDGLLGDPKFGNARYVRTLLESAAENRDLRLDTVGYEPSAAELAEISGEDIDAALRDA